jgi:hypothetical protein
VLLSSLRAKQDAARELRERCDRVTGNITAAREAKDTEHPPERLLWAPEERRLAEGEDPLTLIEETLAEPVADYPLLDGDRL